MSEKAFWNLIRKNASGQWIRIENMIGPGTPDCCVAVDGETIWVELKNLKYWSHNLGLRPEQRAWFMKWPGKAFVFAKIKKEFILVRSRDAINNHTKKEWIDIGVGYWEGKVNWDELRHTLGTRPD